MELTRFSAIADKLQQDADGIRRRVPNASSTSTHIMRAEAAALERAVRMIRAEITTATTEAA